MRKGVDAKEVNYRNTYSIAIEVSTKIKHKAATTEKSILLKFCPDIPYYIGKCTIYFFRSNAFLTLRKCRFNTTTLNRHFVWENMR